MDVGRAETSVCLDYPGKKELKKIDREVDLLEEFDYTEYGVLAIVIIGLIGKA